MRLLISGIPLINPYVGVGVYTQRLVRALASEPHSVDWLLLQPSSAPALPFSLPPKHVFPVPVPRYSGFSLIDQNLFANALCRRASDFGPGHVFHSPGPISSLHKPAHTIVTLHDCIYRHFPRYLGRFWIRRKLLEWTEAYARKADLVLTDSQCSARDLAELAGIAPGKIRVVYPWVDEAYYPEPARSSIPGVRSRYKLPAEYWLYIGGFDYRKNVEFLLEAYAKALENAPLPPLVLAGSIPNDPTKPFCDVLGTLKKLGKAAGQVLMLGRIPDEDMPGLYAGASLFLYPSLYEGFGLPPAEAAAVGTPVLACRSSSVPEIVTREECLFDPRSPGELVGKMIHASRFPESFRYELPSRFRQKEALASYLEALAEFP